MLFPARERIIYDKNPLETVVCQLRFPSILKIDAELPAKFQDRIRAEYPLLKQQSLLAGGLKLPPELSKLLGEGLLPVAGGGQQAYDFSAADSQWQVSLTRESVALTAKRYQRWEEFRGRLVNVRAAFEEIYTPSCYSRIGLRYQDVIRRSVLNLKDVEWAKLLEPHIAGELGAPNIAGATQVAKRELLIKLEDGQGQVKIQHGLARASDTDEVCYVIDADFFTDQRTELQDASGKLAHFNVEAARLFRWCITERLHTAMGPRFIPTQAQT
jgi:uncharacterized protein (TIGR04255 family)